MKRRLLACVLSASAALAWAQDGQADFDLDSFFSPDGSAAEGDAAGDAATVSAQPGLLWSGEASVGVISAVVEPFDEEARVDSYTGLSSLRLDATGGAPDQTRLDASLVVTLLYGDGADAARAGAAAMLADDAVADLILGSDGAVVSADLRKLYLSVYTRHADIAAGRMVINYGRGTAFSPVDLFSAVDTSDVELGRTGTDAVRVLVPFGDFSGLDAVAALGGDGLAGARFYGAAGGFDAAAAVVADSLADGTGDLVVGIDAQTDLVVGLVAEAAARLPFADWQPDAGDAVYSAMVGVDYSIGGSWFFDAEYLWNPRSGPSTAEPRFMEGEFRSEHNLFASVSWKPDELTALDLRGIVVPVAEPTPISAAQLSLSAAWSVASGASLVGYALYRSGDVEGTWIDTATPDAGDTERVAFGIRLAVSY
ncbi:MAG: hypothetical protein JXM71_07835 [Spirochaetales bacterium]|nr:hypothetical protein [Spirochaetales bacterium]